MTPRIIILCKNLYKDLAPEHLLASQLAQPLSVRKQAIQRSIQHLFSSIIGFYFLDEADKMSLIQLALPDREHSPAERPQLTPVPLIPASIRVQLLLPEFNIAGWYDRILTSRVAMPKTPMYENNGPIFL
ncbi:hypothetical protein VA613_05375 [Thiobacillus sedimenti]|uniref:Uncharacterized protein n=1 Tax=Thiobacillus sedimenti TaxID=3110231 RepID=A0ABZ1CN71_9PROT|nr:hypothetical protein [Thiobacillus sp. SCUT-2]WRS40301.1 hypothetical protein VA613_05375 [Thiobacillus sp. SCUT-2]